jgi:hypothetical protein
MQNIMFPLYEASLQSFYLARITHMNDNVPMETRIRKILAHMTGLGTIRKKFFTHIVVLFLSLRGCINFLNMAR